MTDIAPANLTLSAIRETVTARPSPTVQPTKAVVTPTPADEETEVAPTSTILPSYLVYLVPTPTAYRADVQKIGIDCELKQEWLQYDVREGETLLSLALATDSALIELREGNCFEPIRGIFAGERVLVPRLPASPVATPAPLFPTDEEAHEALVCDGRRAQILLPASGAQLEGVFALTGSAKLPAHGRYHIAIRPGWSEVYYTYLVAHDSIEGVLALINTEVFGTGAHRLRLTVADGDGEIIEGGICEVSVLFGSP